MLFWRFFAAFPGASVAAAVAELPPADAFYFPYKDKKAVEAHKADEDSFYDNSIPPI